MNGEEEVGVIHENSKSDPIKMGIYIFGPIIFFYYK